MTATAEFLWATGDSNSELVSTAAEMRAHSLQRHHNGRDCISNHRRLDCVLNRLFRRRSKKTSKLHVTGLCEGNSLMTGGFPAQRASVAENVSVWWRHHVTCFIIVAGWESDTDLRWTYLIFQCFTKCSRIKKALHVSEAAAIDTVVKFGLDITRIPLRTDGRWKAYL